MKERDQREDDAVFELPKSKSQVKRELLALQKLGVDLIEYKGKDFSQFPISDRLREAVLHARTLSRGALKRQRQFIGGLMIHEDVDAIEQYINPQKREEKKKVDDFHAVEEWRDRLLAEKDVALDELLLQYPTIDRQRLMQWVRNAAKEKQAQKPPKSARLLFQYLSSIIYPK
jgi:ribosome-associated protein